MSNDELTNPETLRHSHKHMPEGRRVFDPQQLLMMEERRRSFMPPEKILSDWLIQPSTRLADLGCGTGFFTIPAAKMLTQGMVYAVDVQEDMVRLTMQRVESEGLSNVVGMVGSAHQLELEDKCVDAVLLSMVFHDISESEALLSDIKRILVPQGSLYMVEWDKVETAFGPPMDIRIHPDDLRHILETAGFAIRDLHYSESEQAAYFVHASLL